MKTASTRTFGGWESIGMKDPAVAVPMVHTGSLSASPYIRIARCEGKQLFHPLRATITAKSSGPELDKLIPLIETASRLRVKDVLSCKDRVKTFLTRYGG